MPFCVSSVLMMTVLGSRQWVVAISCYVLSLLTVPVLTSSVCEWLLCPCVFQGHWWCLLLAFQKVSSCYVLLCFKPSDNKHLWFFSQWVAFMPQWVSNHTISVLGFSGCEWLPCLAIFQTCWQYLSSTLQLVSGYHFSLFRSLTMPIWSLQEVGDSLLLCVWWLPIIPVLGSLLIILIPGLLACECILSFQAC